jgi:hypothetical protein
VDEETGVQGHTIHVNELIDAINGVPTVFTYITCLKVWGRETSNITVARNA